MLTSTGFQQQLFSATAGDLLELTVMALVGLGTVQSKPFIFKKMFSNSEQSRRWVGQLGAQKRRVGDIFVSYKNTVFY